MHTFDYLILISDHNSDLEFLNEGPIVLESVKNPKSTIPMPNVVDICFPESTSRTYSLLEQTQMIMIYPTFLVSSFVVQSTIYYLMYIRYDIPLPDNGRGNFLWNTILRKRRVKIRSSHARYAICLVSCIPFFSSAKAILSFLISAYIDIPSPVIDPYNINHILTIPTIFSETEPTCSLKEMISVILSIETLSSCSVAEIHLGGNIFSSNSWEYNIFPAVSELTILACTTLDFDNLINIVMYMLTDTRIIMVSSDPGLTTLSIHGVKSLIFPFLWNLPNAFIPLLSYRQLSILRSSYPYLCGVTREMLSMSVFQQTTNFVLVDLDNNLLVKPQDPSICNISYVSDVIKVFSQRYRTIVPTIYTIEEYIRTVGMNFGEEAESWKGKSISSVFNLDKVYCPYNVKLPNHSIDSKQGESESSLFSLTAEHSQWAIEIRLIIFEFLAFILRDFEEFFYPNREHPLYDDEGFLSRHMATQDSILASIIHSKIFTRHLMMISEGDRRIESLIEMKNLFLRYSSVEEAHQAMYRIVCKKKNTFKRKVYKPIKSSISNFRKVRIPSFSDQSMPIPKAIDSAGPIFSYRDISTDERLRPNLVCFTRYQPEKDVSVRRSTRVSSGSTGSSSSSNLRLSTPALGDETIIDAEMIVHQYGYYLTSSTEDDSMTEPLMKNMI